MYFLSIDTKKNNKVRDATRTRGGLMKTKLTAYAMCLCAGFLVGCDDEEKLEEIKEEILFINDLKEAGEKANKLVGTAISSGVISSGESEYLDFLAAQFNYTTPENIAKWGSLQPNNANEWQFDKLDSMLELTEANQQKFKGHALVWHRQAPSFVTDALSYDELSSLITTHINETAGRYQGRVYAWDVVNEVIGDDANYRDSVFYRVMGKDYIAQAFHDAKAADPETKLYYNDYGIASINAKSDAVYQMISELVESGVPIDGVGFQMHLEASTAPTTQAMVDNLERFTALGLSVNISELDVRVASLPWDQPIKLAMQQQVYHRAVTACMQVAGCEAISTWGFTDKYTWVDSEFGEDDPLLLDESYQFKPAFFGMADALLSIAPDAVEQLPNLIANGHAELNLNGWSTWAGKLSREGAYSKTGKASVKVSDRTETFQGPVYDITGLVSAGQTYQASVYSRVLSKTDQATALSAKFVCTDNQEHFVSVAEGVSQTFEWTLLEGSLNTPDCELSQAELYVEGPEAGVSLIVDGLALRPTVLIPNTDGFGENLIANSGLESDTTGWYGFGDPVIERTQEQPYSGMYSGVATNRLDTWQGAAYGVTEIVEAGKQYQLFGWVKTSMGSSQIRATLKLACSGGDQYVGIGGANANAESWQLLAGQVQVPNCSFTNAEVYFEGPDAGVDIYFDEVTLHKKIEPELPKDTIFADDFEGELSGWVAWGDATISLSNADSNSGSQSALVSGRTASWQGPVFDLLPLVQPAQALSISVHGKIAGASSDNLQVTFKTVCTGETEAYNSVGTTAVNDSEWTEVNANFSVPDCNLSEVFMYFDGAAAGVDILIDDVEVLAEQTVDLDNLISNSGFEQGISPWVAWGDASVVRTEEFAYSGVQSAKVENRTATWQSAVYDLLSVAEAEQTYNVKLYARISGASAADLSITLKTRCDGETESYMGAGTTQVIDSDWSEVTGQFTLPACTLAETFIYFDGPDAGIDIYLDDVEVKLAN